MSLTDEDLKIIAEDLPGDGGRSSDARSRLLCVQELMRFATDSNHGLTASEIAKILAYRSEDGKVPSEATVLEDIHAIETNGPVGIEIEVPTRGKSGGIRRVKSLLSDVEIRMLQNVVRASKFITAKQARTLNNSLDNLLSFHDQDKITKTVFVDRRQRATDPDVLDASQKISEALSRGKKLEFTYVNWNLNNRSFTLKRNGTDRICETPVNLIYSFDNYYVEMWSDTNEGHGHVSTRRLDRMRDVVVSEDDAVKNAEIEEMQATVEERTKQTFDMLGGDVAELFLEVSWDKANMIYNRFGKDYKFENVVNNEHGIPTKGYLRIQVQLSATFFRWIFGFQGGIKIIPPKNSIWNRAGSWANLPTANKPASELRDDYEKAVTMYHEMLERGQEAVG